MFCKWCGVPNDDDAVFCKGCGRSVDDRTNPVSAPIAYDGQDAQHTQRVPPPPTTTEPFVSASVGAAPPARLNATIPILVVVVVALGLTLGGALLLRTRDDADQRTGDAGQGGSRTSEPSGDPVTSDADPGKPVTDPPTDDPAVTDPPPSDPSATEPAVETVASDPADAAPGDGVLRLGGLVPETGNLAFLGPPVQAGIDAAIEDINTAGGVLGVPVEFLGGDSGDNGEVANATADRLIGEGVDGFIGAVSSFVSLTVIDKVTQNGTMLFSPANTSTEFVDYADSGLYFRTSPSDAVQGTALADLVIEDGNASVVLLMLDDGYATTLGDFFIDRFENSGGLVLDSRIYAGRADPFDAQIAPLLDSVLVNGPDAVVVIGFDETADILNGFIAGGDGPQARAYYGTDGNMGNNLGIEVRDQAALAGMRGTFPGADVLGRIPDFAARLDAATGGLDDYSYSAESYDAVVITALASEAAGTDDAVGFAPQIVEVTRGGQVCTAFVECRDLIRAGVDIDYDGLSGPVDMSDGGELTVASVLTLEFDSSGRVFVAGTQITRI